MGTWGNGNEKRKYDDDQMINGDEKPGERCEWRGGPYYKLMEPSLIISIMNIAFAPAATAKENSSF